MANKQKKLTGKGGSARYAGLPHSVVSSNSFKQLSGTACKILILLIYQYNGHNNGDLSAPFSMANQWGIGSKSTLAKALRELIDKRFITVTRTYRRNRDNPHGQCNLYALTWQRIDECRGKLDVAPTTTPSRIFTIDKG